MSTITNIFLDRDGTLIEEEHYLRDPDRVRLVPGIAAPWRVLAENGCRFFLVTNQSGIGRGLFGREDYLRVHSRLQQLLEEQGLPLMDTAFCPHAPAEKCRCRKPAPGMWAELAQKHDLRPSETVMVGDKIADVHFGLTVGCAQTVLVLTGHGRKEAQKLGLPPLPDHLDYQELLPGPDRPQIQARSLSVYLNLLVQEMT
jgi:D-glycero-D-manno-heptose 1,7-bisphosphate phosphatase